MDELKKYLVCSEPHGLACPSARPYYCISGQHIICDAWVNDVVPGGPPSLVSGMNTKTHCRQHTTDQGYAPAIAALRWRDVLGDVFLKSLGLRWRDVVRSTAALVYLDTDTGIPAHPTHYCPSYGHAVLLSHALDTAFCPLHEHKTVFRIPYTPPLGVPALVLPTTVSSLRFTKTRKLTWSDTQWRVEFLDPEPVCPLELRVAQCQHENIYQGVYYVDATQTMALQPLPSLTAPLYLLRIADPPLVWPALPTTWPPPKTGDQCLPYQLDLLRQHPLAAVPWEPSEHVPPPTADGRQSMDVLDVPLAFTPFRRFYIYVTASPVFECACVICGRRYDRLWQMAASRCGQLLMDHVRIDSIVWQQGATRQLLVDRVGYRPGSSPCEQRQHALLNPASLLPPLTQASIRLPPHTFLGRSQNSLVTHGYYVLLYTDPSTPQHCRRVQCTVCYTDYATWSAYVAASCGAVFRTVALQIKPRDSPVWQPAADLLVLP